MRVILRGCDLKEYDVMNRIFVLFAVLLTASSLTVNAADNYWVVGSFEFPRNAMKEAERIRNKTGLDIQVAQYGVAGITYNRLVLKKDSSAGQQQAMATLDVVPWTLYEGGARVARYNPPARQMREPRRRESHDDEPETRVVYQSVDVTPPRSNESYVEYCVQKANPKERELFCSDGMLKRVMSTSVN